VFVARVGSLERHRRRPGGQHQVDDVGQRDVALVRALVVAPAQVQPDPVPDLKGNGLAAEARQALGQVGRITRLADLAVVDDVHARVELAPDRLRHRRPDRLLVVAVGQAGEPGQAAGVGGQDAIGARPH
jgi:hypothetical protein